MVAVKIAVGDLEWSRRSSKCLGFVWGVFNSPSMFQAVLWNARVASGMLKGCWKGLESAY